MIDHFFDCFNVTDYLSGKHKRKPFQDPFRKGDFRLKVDYVLFDIAFYKIFTCHIVVGRRISFICKRVGGKC